MSATLTFLGTADSKGVPRFWCGCPVCSDARGGGINRRTRSAALVQGNGETLLLDCGPDLHVQLARLPGPRVPSAVLISHAHNDHLLGLGDLLDYVRYAAGKLRLYAPEEVILQIAERFPYAFRSVSPVQPLPGEGLFVAGLRVQAFRVPHGANGHSHAFSLTRPGFRAAYVTDAIDIPEEVARAWLGDLDLLVLGTSFADESAAVHAGRSVYDVREALALPWARAARRVCLSHLSHDVDVRTLALPDGWAFAGDGLQVSLSPGPAL
ncbi:MBL fold metallo-hydrolase [Deinococcus hopiensis]|uniref:Phosphoribosyl 1,2-cyclic phosphate phosphodiesterase n=1 Tax=Deinococcus hopiensis KR-140 TaxID=695939 RepID=A0A1W1VMA5_9DEIO|nr:MBL fold metallo-hydrolase [Deinococcus hopiensis]SMB94502.1 phosphoribosyl 1,2-cyclic phosphate phosphodiesterase [Deinococcus hopiensis KR-140]